MRLGDGAGRVEKVCEGNGREGEERLYICNTNVGMQKILLKKKRFLRFHCEVCGKERIFYCMQI